MATLIIPNTVQVDMLFTQFGQNVEMRHYVDNLAPVDAAALEEIAGVYQVWLSGELMPLLGSELTFRGVQTRDLTTADGAEFLLLQTPPQAGGSTTGTAPGNVTIAVSLRSAHRGRSARGRSYVPGMPVAGLNGNALFPTFATDLQDAFNSLISAIQTAGRILVVVSRFLDNVERTAPVLYEIITAVLTDTSVDSQRRRLNGRGT